MQTLMYYSKQTHRAFKNYEDAEKDAKMYCEVYDINFDHTKHIEICFVYS